MPKIKPPIWAKWATPGMILDMPEKISKRAYKDTKYFAFTGIGSGKIIISVFGNNLANAPNIPKIAPEAPTIGILIIMVYSGESTANCEIS